MDARASAGSRRVVADPSAWGAGLGGSTGRASEAVGVAGAEEGVPGAFEDAGGAAAADPISATIVLIGTVSPSFTRISEITPAAGDGISASTLSVEISNSGSSRSTLFPTFLIPRTIVPPAIDSPLSRVTTSVISIYNSEFTRCKASLCQL